MTKKTDLEIIMLMAETSKFTDYSTFNNTVEPLHKSKTFIEAAAKIKAELEELEQIKERAREIIGNDALGDFPEDPREVASYILGGE